MHNSRQKFNVISNFMYAPSLNETLSCNRKVNFRNFCPAKSGHYKSFRRERALLLELLYIQVTGRAEHNETFSRRKRLPLLLKLIFEFIKSSPSLIYTTFLGALSIDNDLWDRHALMLETTTMENKDLVHTRWLIAVSFMARFHFIFCRLQEGTTGRRKGHIL